MKKIILTILFVLFFCTVCWGQQLTPSPYVYSLVPPIQAYEYQPPPITVIRVPRPAFYIKDCRGPFFGLFAPWVPIYIHPQKQEQPQ